MRPNPQLLADMVTFTKEFLNGKLDLLCSGREPTESFFHQKIPIVNRSSY